MSDDIAYTIMTAATTDDGTERANCDGKPNASKACDNTVHCRCRAWSTEATSRGSRDRATKLRAMVRSQKGAPPPPFRGGELALTSFPLLAV